MCMCVQIHVCLSTCAKVRGQFSRVGFLLSDGSQGLSSGDEDERQVTFASRVISEAFV